jgi:hypothetical protein
VRSTKCLSDTRTCEWSFSPAVVGYFAPHHRRKRANKGEQLKGVAKYMTDIVIVALIGAGAAGFSSVMQFITVTKISRLQKTANETHKGMSELTSQTNGLTSALLKVTGQSERAIGKLEGIAEQKGEQHQGSE